MITGPCSERCDGFRPHATTRGPEGYDAISVGKKKHERDWQLFRPVVRYLVAMITVLTHREDTSGVVSFALLFLEAIQVRIALIFDQSADRASRMLRGGRNPTMSCVAETMLTKKYSKKHAMTRTGHRFAWLKRSSKAEPVRTGNTRQNLSPVHGYSYQSQSSARREVHEPIQLLAGMTGVLGH